MIVCVNDLVEMKVEKNGIGVRFGKSHAYPGDMYECPKCHNRIIVTEHPAVYDPKNEINTIQMPEEED